MKQKIKQKLKKAGKKKIILAVVILLVLVVIGLTAGRFFLGRNRMEVGPDANVQTAKAETGTISTSVTGTGTLESKESAKIKVPVGIEIEQILVEEGDAVTEGQELATVKKGTVAEALLTVEDSVETLEDELDSLENDETLKQTSLEEELSDLKEAKTVLEDLLETGTITADSAGVIAEIYVSEDAETAQSQTTEAGGSTGVAITGTSGTQQEAEVVFLTAEVSETEEQETETPQITESDISVSAPVAGAKPQETITETPQYTGTISWDCSTKTFQADTIYTATIVLTAKEGYVFAEDIQPAVKGADVYSEVVETTEDKSTLRFKAKFAKTAAESAEQNTEKDTTRDTTKAAEKSGTDNAAAGNVGAQASGNTGVQAGASAGTGAVTGNSSASGEAADVQTEQEVENVNLMTAFSLASQEEATVSINVDELDITSVKEGQSATITLDAVEGEEFEGTITKVSASATGENGSVKYPVEITMEKTENMLLGMSASASIQIEEAQDAVLLPAAAIQEDGDSVYVYTEKDEDGNLGGKTEVETGLSDGNQVEILSGIDEGTTVYYISAETSQESGALNMEDFGSEMPQGDFPGGDFQGGEAPSGGMPGGQGGGE